MLYGHFAFYTCRVNSRKVVFALEVMMRYFCWRRGWWRMYESVYWLCGHVYL